ncbi:MAG: glycosyltransferase family 2 protein [bacterium]|nr:glycosyltransferase family 2 protein [bacterium]
MRTIVIIPAYNEERTVGEVVRSVREMIPDVLVIDDGSADATGDRARHAGAIVVRHCVNRGLGAALGTGIAAALRAGADIIVTLDADGQHDPADIAAVVAPIQAGFTDLVIGVRSDASAPVHRRWFHGIANFFTRMLFGVRCSDTQSGFRAFSRRAAERIEIRTNRMEVSSEILAEAVRHELRMTEVPIRTIYTEYSLSKGQGLGEGIRTAWSLLLRRLF